jgi:hypothetical protein
MKYGLEREFKLFLNNYFGPGGIVLAGVDP